MALTNVLREPRREITESVVGLFIVAIVLVADYEIAVWFRTLGDQTLPIPAGMIFGLFAMVFFACVVFLTHLIGESICDRLEARGVQLRPLKRPTRQY